MADIKNNFFSLNHSLDSYNTGDGSLCCVYKINLQINRCEFWDCEKILKCTENRPPVHS